MGSACPLLVISRSAAVASSPSAQRRTPLDPSRSSYATGCQAPALLSHMNFCCADLVGEGYLAWKCVRPWKKTASSVLCSLDHSSWYTVVTNKHPLVGRKKAQRSSVPSRGCTARSWQTGNCSPAMSSPKPVFILCCLLALSGVGGPRLVFRNP